jgi:hypothetical protein
LCVNGSGITLASSDTGFPISADAIEFTGPQPNSSTSSVASTPSATTTAGATSTPAGKSGADVLKVSLTVMVAIIGAAIAIW